MNNSANVELVRSIYADWARGDYSSGDWAHPEIEWVTADGPSPGTWSGPAGMAEGWRDFLSAWEDHRAEPDEFREVDDERVLVLIHVVARGRTSGAEVEQTHSTGASLFHMRDGKVTRLVNYFDRDRAFADLGLAPEADSP